MRFHLLDRIDQCEPGKALRGRKRLTLAEEYLMDHFPGFPIMPGVMQLQSLVEAASWLVRATDDFRHGLVVLREVKSVKYGNMMLPGKTLDVTVELTGRDGDLAMFKGKGETEGVQTVSAQFTLASRSLADSERERRLVQAMRETHDWLTGAARG